MIQLLCSVWFNLFKTPAYNQQLLLKFGGERRNGLTNEYPAIQWPRCPTKQCIVSVTC